ncbi:MAG: hypothetical protein LBH73_07345, partial [Spirochaetaceae bacterium]|nr:hypothetical protein [Spirochaetaceae bacterium]
YRELKLLVSGLALPAYALDLPGGGGKVRLHEGLIAGEKPLGGGCGNGAADGVAGGATDGAAGVTALLLRDDFGRLWPYPSDESPG